MVRYERTPKHADIGRTPLLKTTITDNWGMPASDLFPSILSSLPATLHVKTKFELDVLKSDWGNYPPSFTIDILSKPTGFLENLYNEEFNANSEEEYDIFIPPTFQGNKTSDILFWYGYRGSKTFRRGRGRRRGGKITGKFYLEVYKT